MHLVRPLVAILSALGAAGVVSCRTGLPGGDPDARCPAASGEFPPRACAIVRARAVDRAGRPIPSLGVRVDSYVREQGYAYASGGALTDAEGRFELVVMRVNEFTPPATPDTATVEIKAVAGTTPRPGFSPAARTAVRMRFAPMGERVPPTTGDVVFVLPGGGSQ